MPCVHDVMTPGHVLDEVDGGQQLVALAVGLHHRVLDAVVDHLAEVAGADRAGVHEARVAGMLLAGLVDRRRRLERVEDRLDLGDVVLAAADHQRVAVLQAPDAAGDAGVDVADALLAAASRRAPGRRCTSSCRRRRSTSPSLSSSPSSLTVGPGRLAGGHHHPDHARAPRAPRPAPAGCRRPACPASGRSPRPRDRRGGSARPCCRPSCPARSAPAARRRPLSALRPANRSSSCWPRLRRATAAGSAGQAHRHDQVAVAAGPLGRPRPGSSSVGRLVDTGEDGGLERAGEVHPRPLGVHRGQPVEQERRVEADGQRLAVELDVAALLGLALVVGAAGAQGDLAGRELAAQRRAALGDQGDALGGVGEQADRQRWRWRPTRSA